VGLIALLDLLRFAGTSMAEPTQPPALDDRTVSSAPDVSDLKGSANPA
jgi:hypothetical protein